MLRMHGFILGLRKLRRLLSYPWNFFLLKSCFREDLKMLQIFKSVKRKILTENKIFLKKYP